MTTRTSYVERSASHGFTGQSGALMRKACKFCRINRLIDWRRSLASGIFDCLNPPHKITGKHLRIFVEFLPGRARFEAQIWKVVSDSDCTISFPNQVLHRVRTSRYFAWTSRQDTCECHFFCWLIDWWIDSNFICSSSTGCWCGVVLRFLHVPVYYSALQKILIDDRSDESLLDDEQWYCSNGDPCGNLCVLHVVFGHFPVWISWCFMVRFSFAQGTCKALTPLLVACMFSERHSYKVLSVMMLWKHGYVSLRTVKIVDASIGAAKVTGPFR